MDELLVRFVRLKSGGFRATVVDPDWNPVNDPDDDIYREKPESFGAAVGRSVREWAIAQDEGVKSGDQGASVEKPDGPDEQ
jgi:hypothetical protein